MEELVELDDRRIKGESKRQIKAPCMAGEEA
jgi:hypothetical protein